MRGAISDTLVIAERNVRRMIRQPDYLTFLTIQPVMFVLLFVYVFGGAIKTPGFSYVDFLLPGIIVQAIAFGGTITGVGLAEDLQKGLIDRFRSLPMARMAVLAGRTGSDILLNILQLVVMLIVGAICGFWFDASIPEIALGMVLLLGFGYAISWISAIVGLGVGSVETAQSAGFLWLFPLTFISSAFVPVDTLPAVLEAIAKVNPITLTVDALRHLFLNAPTGGPAVWQAALWEVGLVAVFAPWAVWRFRRVTAR